MKSNTTANSDSEKRAFVFDTRSPADGDLAFISQQPNSALSGNYIFDATDGDGTIVYVIDDWFDLSHAVSSKLKFVASLLGSPTDMTLIRGHAAGIQRHRDRRWNVSKDESKNPTSGNLIFQSQ